jgi:GDP-L-fucose synthase
MINKQSRIYIAGHNGMVGSACLSLFQKLGYKSLITSKRSELDLTSQSQVAKFFKSEKPEVVIDAAAKVGGIWINNEYPYDFLLQNLLIQNNLIKYSYENDVYKLIFLGSSCIFPKLASQPIKEESLLTSSLEETNQWYALAKITGVKLCEALFKKENKQFISLMPTNLYGPNDNFHHKTSHVLPAMIRKFHEAKSNNKDEVILWGDGSPLREFLFVDDLAHAIHFACQNHMEHHIYNIGSGEELSIKRLSEVVSDEVGYNGKIIWNLNMPNGTPRKLLDSSKFSSFGWKPNVKINEGVKSTYQWFLHNYLNIL